MGWDLRTPKSGLLICIIQIPYAKVIKEFIFIFMLGGMLVLVHAWVVWMKQWGRFWRRAALILEDEWTQKHERCWDSYGSHRQWKKV